MAKYKIEEFVKYIGSRRKYLIGNIGFIIGTKGDCSILLEYKLRSDEYLVDFGSEDDFLLVIREKQLEKVVKVNNNESK